MIKTGEVIQLNDSAHDGMQSLTVYGNTRQNLWVNPSGTNSGITVTANANGSITLSGTATANAYIYLSTYILRPGSTYCFSCGGAIPNGVAFYIEHAADGYIGLNSTINEKVFTAKSSIDGSCVFGISVTSGTTVSGTYRIMLNEGSEPEPWCHPGLNGVEELSVVCAGKNLLRTPSNARSDVGVSVTKHDDGSVTFNGTATDVFWFYDTALDFYLPSGTYTLSGFDEYPEALRGNVRVERIYEPGGGSVKRLVGLDATTGTVEDGGPHYARFVISAAAGSEFNNVTIRPQLELGSTATAYEPPNVTSTPIDLDGHALNSLPDGTRDELRIDGTGAVTLVQRVGVETWNGDESWSRKDGAGSHDGYFNFPTGAAEYGARLSMLADRVPIGNPYNEDGTLACVYRATNVSGNAGRRLRVVGYDTSEDFESFLSSNPITVLYPLATPQGVELPGIAMPKLKKRTPTVIFAAATVAAEMELDYRKWRQGADGFRVGQRHSFWTEGQCIASSNSGSPEKKSSTKTVPYMSGFYDFSALYGAVAFESRELQYRFELVGDDMADLQEQKSALLNWLATIQDQDIHDDTVPGWHYRGSFDSADWEEGDEGESGALAVTFLCQPFLIADEETSQTLAVGTRAVTNGGQAVNPYASVASGTGTIILDGITQSVGTTPVRLTGQLLPGDNQVQVSGASVTLTWQERRI